VPPDVVRQGERRYGQSEPVRSGVRCGPGAGPAGVGRRVRRDLPGGRPGLCGVLLAFGGGRLQQPGQESRPAGQAGGRRPVRRHLLGPPRSGLASGAGRRQVTPRPGRALARRCSARRARRAHRATKLDPALEETSPSYGCRVAAGRGGKAGPAVCPGFRSFEVSRKVNR